MNKKRIYLDYFRDMIEYAEKAERILSGVEFEDFQNDELKMLAVVRALEIIGEAAKHIPKMIRDKYAEIPWRKITGMRDKMIHEYFGIDHEVVWRTVRENLPPFRKALLNIVEKMEEENQ
jgi:uncharacterized protein with HEPN domain